MTTRDTIEKWVQRFNAADVEGISALYADDAVNHQIALEPVVGRAAIEEFHRETFAGGPLTCTAINLVVDGEWGGAGVDRPGRVSRMRFLPDPRRADRVPAGLLGQRATSSGSP